MALKKSELYSSLWSSCDELRGGMDASQYKDYVLVLLFIKYVSDKYAGLPYAPITIPPGASFKDMVALKGKSDIDDQINKKIIAPLTNANKLSDMPDLTTPPSSAAAKRWWTGSPISSPFSRTRLSTSPETAPRAMTSWAMPTNT
jgi:type I restriction enzyme M protein